MSDVAASRLASSLDRLGTESAFSVLARAKELEREGRDVIHLEIGEPDFDTPAHVCEAAFAAMRAGYTHYCPSAGMPELREAAAAYLSDGRGIDVAAGAGADRKRGKAVPVLHDPRRLRPRGRGDLPGPGVPDLRIGRSPGPARCRCRYRSTRRRISSSTSASWRRACRRGRSWSILNSPQNPTGGVIDPTTIDETAALLQESNAWVLSDEVYWRLVYDGEFTSIASRPGMLERTILLDGLSKAYAMTGWRCGFAAVPEPLIDPLVRFFVNSTSCVPPFVQLAGVAALTGPQDAGGSNARRVPQPPTARRRPAERHPRHQLPAPGRSLLRLSERRLAPRER